MTNYFKDLDSHPGMFIEYNTFNDTVPAAQLMFGRRVLTKTRCRQAHLVRALPSHQLQELIKHLGD